MADGRLGSALRSAAPLASTPFPFGAPVAVFVNRRRRIRSGTGRSPRTRSATSSAYSPPRVLFGMLYERERSPIGLAIAIGAAGLVTYNDPNSWDRRLRLRSRSRSRSPGSRAWRWAASSRKPPARVERAERLEREREAEARAAVAEERARIARELHDIVGSLGERDDRAGLRRAPAPSRDQEREREALITVEETGRAALAEMRRLVGVLRRPEEAPALAPQPSLEHIEKLVEQTREAGLPTELTVEGEPRRLPAGIDLTAYRLVQEGLTNALKHSHATHAEVHVRYADGVGRARRARQRQRQREGRRRRSRARGHARARRRHRRRAAAGPRPSGGYELRARLPVAAE